MDAPRDCPFDEAIAAALDWWRDAGVDCDFQDAPASWLAAPQAEDDGPQDRSQAPAPPPATAAPPAPALPAIDPATIPQDLPGFIAWWLAEPALDDGRTAGRVPPRGGVGAQIMVLVPQPEREDGESLLSGSEGALLSSMLRAMGVAPDQVADQVYVASLLPRHTPHADWGAAEAAGLGAVIARHVQLVAPRRLIAFTGNSLPLAHNDPTLSPDALRRFNHEGGTVPLLAERTLSALIERPRWKAGFWQRWLDFSK